MPRIACLIGLPIGLLLISGCGLFQSRPADPQPEPASATARADEPIAAATPAAPPSRDEQQTLVVLPSGAPALVNQVPAAEEPVDVTTAEVSSPAAETTVPSPAQDCEEPADKSSGDKMAQPALDDALDFIETAQDFWQEGELEKALAALDQAYSLILRVDINDRPKLMQQKEDLRFLISKRILEIYASRHIVVNGSHDAIPMEMNRHVQNEIKKFTSVEKKFFRASYRRSGAYRPMILEELRKAGLPEELSWLPLIESGYKVRAMSRARALGMWQFISSTGYKFGLKRTQYVDERLDPVKSTHAAIAYMKELHQMFGDWATVLAAYNCGEGRVLRVIRSQNINYLDNFWDLYEKLPRETARYVPRFLATLHMVRNPSGYGLDTITLDPPMAYETVTIRRQIHLDDAARMLAVGSKTLKALNPELRYRIVPPESYALRVPEGQGAALQAKLKSLPIAAVPQPAYVKHRVRNGETLSAIAIRYGTSVNRIARANNMRGTHFIRAGKVLKIPQRGYARKAYAARTVTDGAVVTHQVRRGDSLWNLARQYGTTTKKIQATNGMTSTALHIGQMLKIPTAVSKTTTASKGSKKGLRVYQVRPGDNPFAIAKKHNMPLQRFQRINHLSSRSRIYPGQELYVD